ncbi:hypothetical protein FRC15_003139, partial [Serendipita sp. 397]
MADPVYTPLSQVDDASRYGPQSSRGPDYYNRNHYQAPRRSNSSSDDEEEEDETKYPTIDHDEEELAGLHDTEDTRPTVLRYFIWALVAIIICAILLGVVAARSYNGAKFKIKGRRHIEMDHVFNGTFWPETKSVHWVPEAGDGVFSIDQFGEILLVDLKINKTTSLVKRSAVTDERGRPLVWNQWKLSPDAKFILFQTDRIKGWRHSSFGNYYVHDLEHGTTKPLVTPSDPPVVTYATWAPTRNAVAFVSDNDLYVVPSPGNDPVRITEGGNSTIFHAIPDWVYEEEVYSSNFALWWSSKGSKVSFLRFDETDVNDFTYPIYNPTDDADTVVPYPRQVTMKYPKPGYNNPLVTVHLFDLDGYLEAAGGANAKGHTWQLSWDDQRPETDSIIQEVAWINDDTLIIKEVNRSGDAGGEGFNHIALFSPTDSKTPIWLTKGSWEVTSKILGIDYSKKLVYFVAAAPSSIERHVYAAKLPDLNAANHEPEPPTALTDDQQPAYYSANFSPKNGFYVLNYAGPNVPWQKIVQIDKPDFHYTLTDNKDLIETSDRFQMPSIVRSTIMSDGYELNTMEIRPPSMDETGRTKYAVLFRVYGGPGSQMVSLQWDRDWHHYLACSMKYIVVVVDGRGTGFKGRKLRNPVRNNLGEHEVQDQINAAKHWKSKRYVDSRRIGIWGWSYGGFMSSKVVEANAGVHSLAMAVAP